MNGEPADPILRVGLVGAGQWAQTFAAPMIANSAELTLVGIWARRRESAANLATLYGTSVFERVEQLASEVDALVYAVPPAVQTELAQQLAPSGRAMLLEKPLGATVADAAALAQRLSEHDVPSQVLFTNRYAPPMRDALADLDRLRPTGAHVGFVSGGAIQGGSNAASWRLEHGALLDLGPHVIDILEAACGPILSIASAGDPLGIMHLLCEHTNGASSSASLSITTPGEPSALTLHAWGRTGRRIVELDWSDRPDRPAVLDTTRHVVAAEFANTIRTRRSHDLDAAHALHVQRLVAAASASRVFDGLDRRTPHR